METTKLYTIAESNGITVDRFNMKLNGSASVFMDDKYFIAVDSSLCGKKEKVSLAHEMGHCLTGSFYNIYAPLDIRKKHERRADCWAIKKLVPKSVYKMALRHGIDTLYELSEYFGVTCEFMQKAIDYYKENK